MASPPDPAAAVAFFRFAAGPFFPGVPGSLSLVEFRLFLLAFFTGAPLSEVGVASGVMHSVVWTCLWVIWPEVTPGSSSFASVSGGGGGIWTSASHTVEDAVDESGFATAASLTSGSFAVVKTGTGNLMLSVGLITVTCGVPSALWVMTVGTADPPDGVAGDAVDGSG